MDLGFIFLILAALFLRNRLKHARRRRQEENLWREVVKRVEQKRKLDELYGRNQGR